MMFLKILSIFRYPIFKIFLFIVQVNGFNVLVIGKQGLDSDSGLDKEKKHVFEFWIK